MKTHADLLAVGILLAVNVNIFGQAGSIESLLDPTFAPRLTSTYDGKEYDASIHAVALQPEGKILIGGDFANVNGVSRAHIARLNADGSLNMSFDLGSGPTNTNPVCKYEFVTALAVTEETIFIGGQFTSFNGASRI